MNGSNLRIARVGWWLSLLWLSCGPAAVESTELPTASPTATAPQAGMLLVPAGVLVSAALGTVQVDSFWMDATEVTNREFQRFVAATGYTTVAERALVWEELAATLPHGSPALPDSMLRAGALVFRNTKAAVSLHDPGQWWQWTVGANWRHPGGPGSSIAARMEHPVVQIAWADAVAYADWAGKRLPTEAEWEWAARAGDNQVLYPWGNESATDQANFWQGPFPYENRAEDGFVQTAPVGSYAPNAYGLYDMAGNVWEWCADPFNNRFSTPTAAAQRVMRGGSFLCSEAYCSGYRNDQRMGSTPDSGFNHTGFRCARSRTSTPQR